MASSKTWSGGIAAGLDRRCARRTVVPDHLAHEVPLHQRFAARKRSRRRRSARRASRLLQQPSRQTSGAVSRFPAIRRRPSGQTGDALTAGDAVPPGARRPPLQAPQCTQADVADHQLRRGREALGVVAPHAAQRAALQEHRRAHARAVVHREFLDVEYRCPVMDSHVQLDALDDVILIALVQLDEVAAPAPHAHDQVAVLAPDAPARRAAAHG